MVIFHSYVSLPEGNPSTNPYRLLIDKFHKTNDIVPMFLASITILPTEIAHSNPAPTISSTMLSTKQNAT